MSKRIEIDITDFEVVTRIVNCAVELINYLYPNGEWIGTIYLTKGPTFLVLVNKLRLALEGKNV